MQNISITMRTRPLSHAKDVKYPKILPVVLDLICQGHPSGCIFCVSHILTCLYW